MHRLLTCPTGMQHVEPSAPATIADTPERIARCLTLTRGDRLVCLIMQDISIG